MFFFNNIRCDVFAGSSTNRPIPYNVYLAYLSFALILEALSSAVLDNSFIYIFFNKKRYTCNIIANFSGLKLLRADQSSQLLDHTKSDDDSET